MIIVGIPDALNKSEESPRTWIQPIESTETDWRQNRYNRIKKRAPTALFYGWSLLRKKRKKRFVVGELAAAESGKRSICRDKIMS